MWARIHTLEEDKSKPAQAELSSLCPTTTGSHNETQGRAGLEEAEQRDTGCKKKEAEGKEEWGADAKRKDREEAAVVIQTNWREHRNRVCNVTHLCKSRLFDV